MGVKIGNNTLLAGDTVLESGERVNVSRTNAGDTTAPLAMAVTSADDSPAYDPAWLSDPNGIVNVAMVDAMIDAAGGGSAFDDYFTLENSNSSWISLGPKSKGADLTISTEMGNIHILTNKRIYLCSYGSSLDMCGESVMLGTNDYAVLQATSGGSVTISANTSLNLVDASGSYTLGDLARVGNVYYIESATPQSAVSLSDWSILSLPAGWYKVEVLLFSPTDVAIYMLILNATGMDGRIRSVQSMLYGGGNINSGVPYCYFHTQSPWSGGGTNGAKTTCRIAQLNFLYKHVPSKGIDWMLMEDLTKFYGGSVRYTPINIPDEL